MHILYYINNYVTIVTKAALISGHLVANQMICYMYITANYRMCCLLFRQWKVSSHLAQSVTTFVYMYINLHIFVKKVYKNEKNIITIKKQNV